MKCEHCGEALHDGEVFCGHCGHRMRRASTPTPTDPARFDRVLHHPGYELARQHPPMPSTVHAIIGPVIILVVMIVFTIVVAGLVFNDKDPSSVILVPLLLICVGLAIAACVDIVEGYRFHTTPMRHAIMVVVEERTRDLGGPKNGTTRLYYATLASRDGVRREMVCDPQIADKIVPGDIGVAFMKHTSLVGFTRFHE